MAAEEEDCQFLGYNNRDGLLTNWIRLGKKDNEQKMHSPLRERIVGYTVSVSVSISALSGAYVPDTGTPQSSLSTGLCDLCMVVGRLLGEFWVGSMMDSFVVMLLVGEFVVWWLVLDSHWRGIIAGYTGLWNQCYLTHTEQQKCIKQSVQTDLHRAAKMECANSLAQQKAQAKNSKWHFFEKLKSCFLAKMFSVAEI